MLSKEKQEYFKELLTKRLADLLDEANKTVSGMTDLRENFPDPTDRAALEAERNLTLRIRDRERKLRNKIEEAMARLEEGNFGICEVCGEKIGFKRLEARPVTTLCINCQEEQEVDEEKHQGGYPATSSFSGQTQGGMNDPVASGGECTRIKRFIEMPKRIGVHFSMGLKLTQPGQAWLFPPPSLIAIPLT